MRTGFSYSYRFVRISDRGTPIAVFGTGGPAPVAAHAGRGRPPSVVVERGDTFMFYAAQPLEPLLRILRRFDGDMQRLVDDKLFGFQATPPVDCMFRLAPMWPIDAEVQRLYALEVLGKSPTALKLLEPPGVWARQLPVLFVAPLHAMGAIVASAKKG